MSKIRYLSFQSWYPMVLGIGFLSLGFAALDANAQTSDKKPSTPVKCVLIPKVEAPPPPEDVTPASDDGRPKAVAPPVENPCPAGMVEEPHCGGNCYQPKGMPPVLSKHE